MERLYHHKTDGGAEYLYDTYIVCPNGHLEGAITDETKLCVRIDGNIEEDAEVICNKYRDSAAQLKAERDELVEALRTMLCAFPDASHGGQAIAINQARALLDRLS